MICDRLGEAPVWNNPHDAHVWVNLSLARLAAAHIRSHPESISGARAKMARWMAWESFTPGMMTSGQEWLDLIDTLSPSQLADLLESESDDAIRLRSSMPFIREPFFSRAESLPILEKAYSR
jgi:hypothetical protein